MPAALLCVITPHRGCCILLHRHHLSLKHQNTHQTQTLCMTPPCHESWPMRATEFYFLFEKKLLTSRVREIKVAIKRRQVDSVKCHMWHARGCSIILFTIIVISSSLLFLACSSLDPISALIRDCFLWVCSTSFFYEHNLYTWICIFKIFFSSYVLYFFFLFAAFYQSVDQYDDCKEIGLSKCFSFCFSEFWGGYLLYYTILYHSNRSIMD